MFYVILAMIVLFVVLIYFKTKNYVDYLHNCIDDYEITIKDLRQEREELLNQIKIQNDNEDYIAKIRKDIEEIEKENELNI